MAFDIYAGGFARYLAREWENVVQKAARETGTPYQMIRPGNDPGPLRWEEVQEHVQEWRAAIVQGLKEHAPADLDWDEGRQAPYFTDRPGWDGYSALVLLAACTACGEPLPERLSEEALVSDVVLRANAANPGHYRSITQVQLWLPGTFEFSFDFMDLFHEKIHIGSVRRLVLDLEELMRAQAITETEVATALPGTSGGEPSFRTIACFGLGVFRRVAQDAFKHRLPMRLSF